MEADLNPILEKYKKTIIKDTIKKIYGKYTVYDDDENIVNEKEIIEYLNKLNNPVKKRCCGVSKSGIPKQCKAFAITNFDYCRNHMMTYGIQSKNNEKNTERIEISLTKEEKCNQKVDLSKLKKKFINDSFYYIDNLFIYDNFNEKVGYIDNGIYVLTDDPFILNNF
jgi:hypothetical protein